MTETLECLEHSWNKEIETNRYWKANPNYLILTGYCGLLSKETEIKAGSLISRGGLNYSLMINIFTLEFNKS